MKSEIIEFIERSFLHELLRDPEITDISYNGSTLFYQHNVQGRKKATVRIGAADAAAFIRQIANMSEQQFSFACPILDVSIGRYRINAVHTSITRVGDGRGVSFSIRIGSLRSRVEDDENFMNEEVRALLARMIAERASIIIGGVTGSGKTELQKHLLGQLPPYSRIIVIDNLRELENLRMHEDLDVTSWNVNPKADSSTFEALIANALRSNPDWLVISEARGREMASVLLSAMTGHPIITTLHAKTIRSMPQRIARMIQLANPAQPLEDILGDVYAHFEYFIFLSRNQSPAGLIERQVAAIAHVDNEHHKLEVIYERDVGTLYPTEHVILTTPAPLGGA